MNTAGRLGLYGAGLVVAFAGAWVTAGAVVPESTVTDWSEKARSHGASGGDHDTTPHDTGEASETSTDNHGSGAGQLPGLSSEAGGHQLTAVRAPAGVGTDGTLSFQVLGPDGEPTADFTTSHTKQLHLVVVRSDGTGFRHVHPTVDDAGTWSVPWTWAQAGSHRVYADFVTARGTALTLTRTVEVAGRYDPADPQPRTRTSVAGFDVEVTGRLTAGKSSDLTLTVTRDGEPVTALEPYLGAFGHLVALRQGDLAFLHVHPTGAEATAGQTSGPGIEFAVQTPTPGRYLLNLDFQVDGQVHTAALVLDAAAPGEQPELSHDSGDDTGDDADTGHAH